MATKQTRSHEHAAPDYFYARCEQGARESRVAAGLAGAGVAGKEGVRGDRTFSG